MSEPVSGAQELAGGKLVLDRPAEAVARLRIRNPEKRNALDHDILGGIADAVPRLVDGIGTRCLIVTGSEGSFSAGYDIGSLPDEVFAEEAERLVAHPFAAAIEAVDAFPYPTVAAVNGHALGGGLELALSCDLRIAARGVKLGMPPAKLGLVYSHTGLAKFIDAIGAPRTKELFFTGRNIDTATAERWGLVNTSCEPQELEDAAVELAAGIAANAPLSLEGNKWVIERITGVARLSQADEAEAIERRLRCFRTEDFREGVRAFAEKRKPQWKGR